MKKQILLTACIVAISFCQMFYAQAPQAFKYQSIVRNSTGNPMENSDISIRASVHEGSSTGLTLYQETHSVTTNVFGLVNLEIGNGSTTTGVFPSIDWGSGTKWMEIEADFGAGYVPMGSSQLLSVPYALNFVPGPAGADGINGVNGKGITSTIDNFNGTFTFIYTDGTTFTTIDLTGPSGTNGSNGSNGTNGTNGIDGAVGATGLTGNNGTNGIDGAVGATGLTGNNGTNGNDGAVGATGLTGNNGTNGNDGAVGATGLTGNNGTNGIDGAVGATGLTGNNGTNGIDGAVGATGLTGNNGTNGIDGAVGATGLTGNNGTNGIDGAVGATGLTGNNGTNGIDGAVGATGLTGNNGTNGIDGAVGATGLTGNNGTNGIDGAVGATGLTGNNGTNGIDGAVGATGLTGNNGTNGIDGAVGATGLTGNNGTNGTNGVDGATGAISQFGMFFGLTSGTGNGAGTDYAATIPVKTVPGTGRVPFPQNGPTAGIARIDNTSFTLPSIGTYEVNFSIHTTEVGQIQLELDGVDLPETVVANMNPTLGGHLIMGSFFVSTTAANSILAVINPSGNSTALTITPADGANTHANSQVLTIKKIL